MRIRHTETSLLIMYAQKISSAAGSLEECTDRLQRRGSLMGWELKEVSNYAIRQH